MAKAKKAQSKTVKANTSEKESKPKGLTIVNGRVKLITTDSAPAHKAGEEINPIETTARKMIVNGWAKVK